MQASPLNVLFLCTGNSGRSVMAEALLNSIGAGRFRAFSAGSHPTGVVNRFAIELLRSNRLTTDGLRSKSWDEFAQPGAPELDFVFTVCDKTAAEVCPIWPGRPMTAHWGVKDPAHIEGDVEARRRAFFHAYSELQNRLRILASLQLERMDRTSLQSELDEIGRAQSAARARDAGTLGQSGAPLS